MGKRLENTLIALGFSGAVLGMTYSLYNTHALRKEESLTQNEYDSKLLRSGAGVAIGLISLSPILLGLGLKVQRDHYEHEINKLNELCNSYKERNQEEIIRRYN